MVFPSRTVEIGESTDVATCTVSIVWGRATPGGAELVGRPRRSRRRRAGSRPRGRVVGGLRGRRRRRRRVGRNDWVSNGGGVVVVVEVVVVVVFVVVVEKGGDGGVEVEVVAL